MNDFNTDITYVANVPESLLEEIFKGEVVRMDQTQAVHPPVAYTDSDGRRWKRVKDSWEKTQEIGKPLQVERNYPNIKGGVAMRFLWETPSKVVW